METIEKLRKCVSEGLQYVVNSSSDILEAEIFATSGENWTARLHFSSHIECDGMVEPKSDGFPVSPKTGVCVRILFEKNRERLIGQGEEDKNITLEGIKLALAKAWENAVADPEFISFPKPTGEKPTLINYHDPALLKISNDVFVNKLAGQALMGALDEFSKQGYHADDDLIIGGGVTLLKEEIAVANSHGINDFDQSTALTANITAMIEKKDAKGTGWASGINLENFDAASAGRMAAKSAIATLNGKQIKSKKYNVILGPQAVCTLFSNLVIRELTLNSACLNITPWREKFGQQVVSEELNVSDNGALPGQMASKKITCEGLPTGKTELIKQGKLVGFMANSYWSNHPQNKYGITQARNGFRFGGGGRFHRIPPMIHATNLIIQGASPISSEKLIKKIQNGVYLGRLWYLYPINLGAGDFSGTVVGDSYTIKDGRLAAPLRPNKVRIDDNWRRLLKDHVLGVSNKAVPTLVWAAEEIVIAPEIALKDVSLKEIDILMMRGG